MIKETNTKELLKEVLVKLERSNIVCWVFGGWAEEFRGLCKPRGHGDIDLLYPAPDFEKVDDFLAQNKQFTEIKGKHFPHKRAFLIKDVAVELFLLESCSDKIVTNYFNQKEYVWPNDTLDEHKIDGLLVASINSLVEYRLKYDQFHSLTPATKPS